MAHANHPPITKRIGTKSPVETTVWAALDLKGPAIAEVEVLEYRKFVNTIPVKTAEGTADVSLKVKKKAAAEWRRRVKSRTYAKTRRAQAVTTAQELKARNDELTAINEEQRKDIADAKFAHEEQKTFIEMLKAKLRLAGVSVQPSLAGGTGLGPTAAMEL